MMRGEQQLQVKGPRLTVDFSQVIKMCKETPAKPILSLSGNEKISYKP
jgi:hypothetical protein